MFLTPSEGTRPPTGPNILLVDPSLFTASYDAALSAGLSASGVRPIWATRGLRPGEEDALGAGPAAAPGRAGAVHRLFYPLTDGPRRRTGRLWQVAKGVEHLTGLRRVATLANRVDAAVVHLQWSVLPALDRLAVRWLQRERPVVMTVHDTEPFNGKRVSVAQRSGYRALLDAVDRLIVHTDAARHVLLGMGLDRDRIDVIPHGLLGPARASALAASPASRAGKRWTLVLFGKIQEYKGVDILIEAVGLMTSEVRATLRVIVAGEALVPLAPLVARAEALGLGDTIEWRPGYLNDAGVEALLDKADAFVFPYRAIEASGVFLLVAGRGAWIVASDLGAFRELIGTDGGAGELVPPGDPAALADALSRSVGRRPTRSVADVVPGWNAIGAATAAAYREAAVTWRAGRTG